MNAEWKNYVHTGGPWVPRRYAVTLWHNHGTEEFVVVTRLSIFKAAAIASLHFAKTWPTLFLWDLRLEDAGEAEMGLNDLGERIYPAPGNPSNEIFDEVEWL